MSENKFWFYLWATLGFLAACTIASCAPACERIDYQEQVTKRLCIEHAGTWNGGKCIGPKGSL